VIGHEVCAMLNGEELPAVEKILYWVRYDNAGDGYE
jgi:hypothetical protein